MTEKISKAFYSIGLFAWFWAIILFYNGQMQNGFGSLMFTPIMFFAGLMTE